MPRIDWPLGPIAHRGLQNAAAGVIENTPEAMARAVVQGFAIEVDLQRARNDAPVVFHDFTLDRLTEATGPVSERTPGELAAVAFKATSDRIMTLDALLEMVAGRIPIYLEIKSDWHHGVAFEQQIASKIAGYQGPLAVMSFDPRVVAAMIELAPGRPRGLISGRHDGYAERAVNGYFKRLALRHLLSAPIARPDFLSYDVSLLPALAPLVGRWLCGRPLLTWTIRNRRDEARAARWADAMIFEGIRPAPRIG